MADKIATREAYGKALVDLGNENGKVVVLDADLAGATMTSSPTSQNYPSSARAGPMTR